MSARTIATLVFYLSLWSLAVLAPQSPRDAQVVTRLALVVSIIDSGSLEITPFAGWTVDKATIGGRVFADKTPGHPLLALPAVALAKLAYQLTGNSTDTRDHKVFDLYSVWATLGSNVIISALAVAVLFVSATDLGASRGMALFAAFALGWATPFFGWSTAFFAHSVTGSCLLFAFAAILRLFPSDPEAGARLRPVLIALLGVLLGYTLVVDLTAAPAVAILGIFALLRARATGAVLPVVLLLAFGGIVGLLPLLVYNALAFGSPWHLGYEDTGFEGMDQGMFGITWPNPAVLLELLIGTYRGLLPLSPILVLVPVGLLQMARTRLAGPSIVIALVIIAQFWINASYFYWNGGWSTGPRHLVAMLPLAALALAFVRPTRIWGRGLIAVLLAVSLGFSLACALAGMFAPEHMSNPIPDWVFANLSTPYNLRPAVPVILAWIGFGVLFVRSARTGSQSQAGGQQPVRPLVEPG